MINAKRAKALRRFVREVQQPTLGNLPAATLLRDTATGSIVIPSVLGRYTYQRLKRGVKDERSKRLEKALSSSKIV